MSASLVNKRHPINYAEEGLLTQAHQLGDFWDLSHMGPQQIWLTFSTWEKSSLTPVEKTSKVFQKKQHVWFLSASLVNKPHPINYVQKGLFRQADPPGDLWDLSHMEPTANLINILYLREDKLDSCGKKIKSFPKET